MKQVWYDPAKDTIYLIELTKTVWLLYMGSDKIEDNESIWRVFRNPEKEGLFLIGDL